MVLRESKGRVRVRERQSAVAVRGVINADFWNGSPRSSLRGRRTPAKLAHMPPGPLSMLAKMFVEQAFVAT
jgi:hypothetical protein